MPAVEFKRLAAWAPAQRFEPWHRLELEGFPAAVDVEHRTRRLEHAPPRVATIGACPLDVVGVAHLRSDELWIRGATQPARHGAGHGEYLLFAAPQNREGRLRRFLEADPIGLTRQVPSCHDVALAQQAPEKLPPLHPNRTSSLTLCEFGIEKLLPLTVSSCCRP